MTTPTPVPVPRRRAWFLGGVMVLLAAVLIALGLNTAHRLAVARHEHRGTVTVASCTFEAFGRHGNTYSCLGNFSPADGDLVVPAVTFDHIGRLDRGERIGAGLSGPDDRTADVEGVRGLVWRGAFLLAGLIGMAALFRALRQARSG
jgi:hypothetical protein